MRSSPLLPLLVVGLAGSAGAAPPRPAAAPPPAALPAPTATFDPASATPYFASGPAAEARRQLERQDFAAAARGFGKYLAGHPKASDRLQARFLQALSRSRGGAFVEAAQQLDALVEDYPLLGDLERLLAARAYLAAKQHDKALARARAVAADSPLAGEAQLVAADALRARGEGGAEAAARLYADYLERFPDSWRAPEVRLRLGQLSSTEAAARAHLRAVYIQFPASSWAAEARARLQAMDGGAPDGGALHLDGPEHLTRGMALLAGMRNEAAEAELTAALASGALTAMQQCTAALHRAKSVFQQRNRPRAAPLYDEAVELCGKVGEPAAADSQAKALYQAARCHAAKRAPGAAIARFARLERDHPAHSYADDARVREAEVLGDVIARLPPALPALPIVPAAMGAGAAPPAARAASDIAAYLEATPEARLDGAVLRASRDALLASIADAYPAGDMAGESLFRLGFGAFEERRLDEARRLLEKELALLPREEGWWEAGRTLYWLGRVAALQQRQADAAALYARAAREYPLSYYALQALNRLREAAPDEEKRLLAELARPQPGADDLRFTFPPDPAFATPAFRRGVELARLGLGAEARRELAAAGLRTAHKGDRPLVEREEPVRAAQLWLTAVLYDRAGEWALSHEIPRHVLTDYGRRWPSGDNRKRWLISYPRGFEPLVVEHAGDNGQPVALQFAIIREESGFVPDLESFANAVGLTQLTQDPARRFARGLPYTREALRDPLVNITIGARELGDLWKSTGATAPLAIAGYNAGLGAVKRWLAQSPPGLAVDEFVERIPYDETRGYTKRVLGSFFAYHYLYEGGDPVPQLGDGLGPLGRRG